MEPSLSAQLGGPSHRILAEDLRKDPVHGSVVQDVDEVAQHDQPVAVGRRRRDVLHGPVQIADDLDAHRPESCTNATLRVMTIKAVVLDYGHTIVDFRRTEEALLEAYGQIRARIEAALEIDAPEVGHLIDRVAGEVDRLVRISYEERRMEELDQATLFREILMLASRKASAYCLS